MGRGVEGGLSRFDYEAFEIGFSLVGFIRLLAAAILLRLCADVKDSNHLIFCTIQIFFAVAYVWMKQASFCLSRLTTIRCKCTDVHEATWESVYKTHKK